MTEEVTRGVLDCDCLPLSLWKKSPPAIWCVLPSCRGDCLLVSGLLLSSALCQVKNNVMPRRAVCSLCPLVRLLHYSIKFPPYSRQLDTGIIIQSLFFKHHFFFPPRETLWHGLYWFSLLAQCFWLILAHIQYIFIFFPLLLIQIQSHKGKIVSKSNERKPQVTAYTSCYKIPQ